MTRIVELGADFTRWPELLALIQTAFAYMDGAIDPPSSAKTLTEEALQAKAAVETVFLAYDDRRLVGCIFCAQRPEALYIGKLAITPDMQARGLGSKLMQRAKQLARATGKASLELQVRIELTGNQAAFSRMGFVETHRTSHPGFERPTSITMRKRLAKTA